MSQQITSSNLVPATESKNIVMNVLTLIIKKKWLDEILSGEKTTEEREIRPNSSHKYLYYKNCATGEIYKRGIDIPDDVFGGESNVPIDFMYHQYDAIQFWAGYETNRPGALVEIKGFEHFTIEDDNGDAITYEYTDGRTYCMAAIEYQLGKVLNKTNC